MPHHRTTLTLASVAVFALAFDAHAGPALQRANKILARYRALAAEVGLRSEARRTGATTNMLEISTPTATVCQGGGGTMVSLPRGGNTLLVALADGYPGVWSGNGTRIVAAPPRFDWNKKAEAIAEARAVAKATLAGALNKGYVPPSAEPQAPSRGLGTDIMFAARGPDGTVYTVDDVGKEDLYLPRRDGRGFTLLEPARYTAGESPYRVLWARPQHVLWSYRDDGSRSSHAFDQRGALASVDKKRASTPERMAWTLQTMQTLARIPVIELP